MRKDALQEYGKGSVGDFLRVVIRFDGRFRFRVICKGLYVPLQGPIGFVAQTTPDNNMCIIVVDQRRPILVEQFATAHIICLNHSRQDVVAFVVGLVAAMSANPCSTASSVTASR